jgi:hypothetical protein
MRVTLSIEAEIEGDTLAETAKAGLFPAAPLTGRRTA